MRYFILIKTASGEANFLALGASIFLLVKILVLNRFPAAFPGAYELGVIVDAVLASIVASYFFYLMVVHVKEQSDRAILQPYIEKHSKSIVGYGVSQLKTFSRISGVELKLSSMLSEGVGLAFSKIDPNSKAPLTTLLSNGELVSGNWMAYFEHFNDRSGSSIRKLLDQIIFLDAELVALLTEIDDCTHFMVIRSMKGVPNSNKDLAAWASSFYEYCVLCQKLNSYLEKRGFSPVSD